MSPSHTTKRGICYRYYISTALVQGRAIEAGSVARVSAQDIETAVANALREAGQGTFIADATIANEHLKNLNLRVEVRQALLRISWGDVCGGDDGEAERHNVEIAYRHVPHKRHREILLPDHASTGARPIREQVQRDLVTAIAQGRAWLQEMLAGTSLHAIADREGKSERSIRMTLSLAFLDPKLVRAALHGTLPRGASAKSLTDAPPLWHEQWQTLGLSRPV
jgi:site-specific DNA recombinase